MWTCELFSEIDQIDWTHELTQENEIQFEVRWIRILSWSDLICMVILNYFVPLKRHKRENDPRPNHPIRNYNFIHAIYYRSTPKIYFSKAFTAF